MNQEIIEKRNSTDIKLLLQIEKYKQEKERLNGVKESQTKKVDKEYFQGHIDSLEGVILDLLELIEK